MAGCSNVRNKLDFQPNGSNWKEKEKRERERETEKVDRILKGGPTRGVRIPLFT